MEAFEDEFVILKRRCSKKSMMDNPENEVVKTVGDGCQWEQRARRKGYEDLSEELYLSYQYKSISISRPLTSFGNESIPTWLAIMSFESENIYIR